LILDLRDTPSGGDTDVAERSSVALSTTRRDISASSNQERPPLSAGQLGQGCRCPRANGEATAFVLVDHWTGSMARGWRSALMRLSAHDCRNQDGWLLGGTGDFTLPHTGVQ